MSNDNFYFITISILGIFEIDPETGVVTITEPIPDDAPEQYNVTILLCDRGTPSQCGRDNLIITIQQAGNNPPRWIFPGDNGQIVELIEVCLTAETRAPNREGVGGCWGVGWGGGRNPPEF